MRLLVALMLVASTAAAAPVPPVLVHAGRLLDGTDKPLAGRQTLTFSLFPDLRNASTGGETPVWTETYEAQVGADGMYTVVLGGPADDSGATNRKPFDERSFAVGQQRFLEISVSGQTLSPRLQVTSVPYAFSSGDAGLLGGQPPSYYATAAVAASKVAQVTAAAPLKLTGSDPTRPDLALARSSTADDGYLAKEDYAKFGAKQDAVVAAAPLSLDAAGHLSIATADATQAGALSAAAWATFDGKANKRGESGYVQNGTSPQGGASFNVDGSGTIGGTLTLGGNATVAGNIVAGNVPSGGYWGGFKSTAPSGAFGFQQDDRALFGLGGDIYTRGFSKNSLWAMNGSTGAEDVGLYNANSPAGNFLVLKAGGSVGIDVASPKAKLDVNGSVRVGADTGACTGRAGAVRWSGTSLELCDGTSWRAVATAPLASTNTQAAPARSCKALKEAGLNVSGTYWIDPNGGSASDAFQAACDMDGDGGGWTEIASILGSTDVTAATYTNGLGQVGDPAYALACAKLASIAGPETTMRVIMGEVHDYYRPTYGADVCAMLTTSPGTRHRWSAAVNGPYVVPTYYGDHLGGSANGWPTGIDGRTYTSFWGGGGSLTGGCCSQHSLNYAPPVDGGGIWGQAFKLHIREP